MPKITTFLWYDTQAEEAARYYTSIFKNAKIKTITHYTDVGPGPKGSVMTVAFELDGHDFVALNGGPAFKFNEAISVALECKNQEEIDYYWEKLSEGGEKVECGWLKDKYGLFWQVMPKAMIEMLSDRDVKKVDRVMTAMMTMKKLDVAELERAYDGR
ncbi:MAG TPA: VOC family protein [Candidatus Krumholzibacteria bacterium]